MNSTEHQQYWQRIFQQWHESGLSKMRFCKEHNIPLLSTPTNIGLVSMTVGSLRL